jgi:nucleotide-binding universal stress UspA family protein
MNEARSGRVVVGVGESLSALQALRCAVAEARRRDTVLRAVRVWHVDTRPDVVSFYAGRDDAGADAASTIRQSFDRAMGGLPRDISFELIAVEGVVGPRLVAQASNEDDLLVLGAPVRRWWSPSRFSLVRYCTRSAACPVLVVPAPMLGRTHGVKASARAIQREVERLVETGESP